MWLKASLIFLFLGVLSNSTNKIAEIIEVQIASYLGEDGIVKYTEYFNNLLEISKSRNGKIVGYNYD